MGDKFYIILHTPENKEAEILPVIFKRITEARGVEAYFFHDHKMECTIYKVDKIIKPGKRNPS